jgi:uncharacterized protein (DUF58 family)
LFSRGGNRVGVVLFNNAVEQTIAPRGGRNHVLHITRELLRPPEPTGTTTDLGALARAGAQIARRRSLIVIVSDFISEPGWERAMTQLTRRHELVAIRLSDPREHELPEAGVIVVEDAETGELLSVDTSDPEFRKRFHEVAEAREAEVRAGAREAGIDLYDVSTEDDLVRALVRIVERRRRRRR